MPPAAIQREEDRVKKSIKDAAKRGDTSTCKMLAKEVVRARKATNRMHTSKAQMNSVVMQMENQLAQQKVTGHMAKSTEVMKMMNKLAKVGEISATMQAMQQEMMKVRALTPTAHTARGRVAAVNSPARLACRPQAGVIEEMVGRVSWGLL